jgi:hypothetical protein
MHGELNTRWPEFMMRLPVHRHLPFLPWTRRQTIQMENVEAPKTPVETESPEIERELRMLAELLLDIYIEKRQARRRPASPDSSGFDTREPGR